MGLVNFLKKSIDKVCPGEWNDHLWEDIFGGKPESKRDALKKAVTWQGAYEHKDKNGNWVPGPALGHGYEGGYDYSRRSREAVDAKFEQIGKKIKGLIAVAYDEQPVEGEIEGA